MKNSLLLSMLSIFTGMVSGFSQENHTLKKDDSGIITSMQIDIEKEKITSSDLFFQKYVFLGSIKDSANKFAMSKSSKMENKNLKNSKTEIKFECYDQYYNEIKVESAGYTLQYNGNYLQSVYGRTINVDNINAKPTISEQKAIEIFAQYKKVKNTDSLEYRSELLIKKLLPNLITTKEVPVLVYKIILEVPEVDEFGYIDAHTGKILKTEPTKLDAIGTFHTLYFFTQYINTDYRGKYYLYNPDTKIKIIDDTNKKEISNATNIWAFFTNLPIIALDTYVGLNLIWQYFYDTYNISS